MRSQIIVGCGIVACAGAVGSADPVDDVAALLGAGVTVGNVLAPNGVQGTITGGAEGWGRHHNPTGTSPVQTVANTYANYTVNPGGVNTAAARALAGQSRDYDWVHDTNSNHLSSNNGIQFEWANTSRYYILDTAIDHTPWPAEALETTLWGWDPAANGGAGDWIKGEIIHLYRRGFDAAAITEDVSSLYKFTTAVKSLRATSGLVQGGYSYLSSDTEIDSITQFAENPVIPLPTTAVMGLVGLSVVGSRRRR